MQNFKILVVIVDFFKGAQVVEAVNSVRAQEYDQENIAITVLDNSCCSQNFQRLLAAQGATVITPSATNIGYVAAVNQAVEQHSGEVDVVLLLSPDIELTNSRTFFLLMENFHAPECLIAGPAQINQDGSYPSIARGYPSLLSLVAKRTALGRTCWGRRRISAYLLSGFDLQQRQQVPWLQSSCVFVRKSFWRETGGLDSRYFLFMADIVICQQAYQQGGHVIYDPRVVVQADGRRCSEGGVLALLRSKALRWHLRDAFIYFRDQLLSR